MHWQQATDSILNTMITYPRFGIVTDVDGTISPIVREPDKAQVTARNHELLTALQSKLPLVAVVSGRSAEDVRHRVGVKGLIYIGNHGLERWEDGEVKASSQVMSFRPAIEAAHNELLPHLADKMFAEDKGATLSIHYRQTDDPQVVAQELFPVLNDIATRHKLHLFQGRMVFEIRPPLNINKGSAFRHLVEEYKLQSALYLGDDTTDVDAFREARHLREQSLCYSWSVGVKSDGTPDAVIHQSDLLASGISDVEALLGWLSEARNASST